MTKEKVLYLDCASGISGDMFAAAMIDLGADQDVLQRALDSIPTGGFHTEISRVKKNAVECCDFSVILDAGLENHDADMEYLYGKKEVHGHGHGHDENHMHSHGHDENHAHGHVDNHVHRTLQDVREILSGCEMTERAAELADRIFVTLAKAEAKAHGTTMDEVHFHEVGSVDSIVDIVTAAVCFDALNIQRVYISPLFEGSGTIRCAHGMLPIPVPAVSNILEASSLRIAVDPDTKGEFITPTGAAIAAAIMTDSHLPKSFSIERTGLGAGKRSYDRPNYLRAMVIIPAEEDQAELFQMETDIDDCGGEILGYVMERLLEAGARDAHYIPVYMKKNRPAWQLQVICDGRDVEKLEEIIFSETTSIGIRRFPIERSVLAREISQVNSPYGTADVKICRFRDQVRFYPEYESVRKLAGKTGLPFEEVYRAVKECARQSV